MVKTKQSLLSPDELVDLGLRDGTIAESVRRGSKAKLALTLVVDDEGRSFGIEELYVGELNRRQFDQVLKVVVDQLQVLSETYYMHMAPIAGE